MASFLLTDFGNVTSCWYWIQSSWALWTSRDVISPVYSTILTPDPPLPGCILGLLLSRSGSSNPVPVQGLDFWGSPLENCHNANNASYGAVKKPGSWSIDPVYWTRSLYKASEMRVTLPHWVDLAACSTGTLIDISVSINLSRGVDISFWNSNNVQPFLGFPSFYHVLKSKFSIGTMVDNIWICIQQSSTPLQLTKTYTNLPHTKAEWSNCR